MKLKRYISLTLAIFIVLINIFTNAYGVSTDTNEANSTENSNSTETNNKINVNSTDFAEPNFTIYSDSAIVIDSKSGKILTGKDINKHVYPASTTKVLTAILAIENCKLDDVLTASYDAVMAIPSGYSNAGISAGESFTVSDLLDMFLIHSANEIGYIFAEHISGSVENFANLMNQKAQEIGCTNTHFTNPSGIHDPEHYSSAYDMALIARYCMKNDTFRNVVSKLSCKIAPTPQYPEERYFKNTNSLMDPSDRYYYQYAIGIKTGFTSQAKNCLISASSKDGIELIAVALGAEATEDGRSGRYVDSINLLEYGNNNYKYENVLTANTVIDEIVVPDATQETENLQLLLKDSISSIVPNDFDLNSLQPNIELNENITAPIAEGAVLGKVTYNINGITYTSDLVASHNVEKSEILLLVGQIALAILVLVVLVIILKPKKKNKRYKKNKKSKAKHSKKNDEYDTIYKFTIDF